MAFTITNEDIAISIRAGTSVNIPADVLAVINYLVPAGKALIEDYTDTAPDAIMDAALIRLVGFMYDADPADSRRIDPLSASGALGLLARFKTHRAGVIGEVIATLTPDMPGGGGIVPAPPAEGHFILTANNGKVTWQKFPAP